MVTTVVIIVIAVVVVLLVRFMHRSWIPANLAAGPENHATGGASSAIQSGNLPDDWITNPSYWWMPGNIFYDEQTDYGSCNRFDDDWNINPACSHIPGNIYCDDDDCMNSTSSWDDDDWSSTSNFDDD